MRIKLQTVQFRTARHRNGGKVEMSLRKNPVLSPFLVNNFFAKKLELPKPTSLKSSNSIGQKMNTNICTVVLALRVMGWFDVSSNFGGTILTNQRVGADQKRFYRTTTT